MTSRARMLADGTQLTRTEESEPTQSLFQVCIIVAEAPEAPECLPQEQDLPEVEVNLEKNTSLI